MESFESHISARQCGAPCKESGNHGYAQNLQKSDRRRVGGIVHRANLREPESGGHQRRGGHFSALRQSGRGCGGGSGEAGVRKMASDAGATAGGDRKSTRLNSSHVKISYAVFCLKKK